MTDRMVRLVYLASFVMVMTTAAGLIWLNLLNRFLKDIGEPIPMAGPLSALLAALVLGMVAYLIWTAKSVTAEAHSHRS